MAEELKITPTSKSIATAIEQRMEDLRISPGKLNRALKGRVCSPTVMRIRKGSSGCLLRNYEDVLSVLGLRLAVIPITHPDVIDGDFVRQNNETSGHIQLNTEKETL